MLFARSAFGARIRFTQVVYQSMRTSVLSIAHLITKYAGNYKAQLQYVLAMSMAEENGGSNVGAEEESWTVRAIWDRCSI